MRPIYGRTLATAVVCVFAVGTDIHAQTQAPPASLVANEHCWRPPAPDTMEETAHALKNAQARSAGYQKTRQVAEPAMLALSDGVLRIAYGAGLLVGWGETGRRPQFAAVTAVGRSALIAPFAFIGTEGDQKIADLINCHEARDWPSLAQHAALLVDAKTVDAIARRHATGARLLIALPGSAARSETVWDLGAIAASKHPRAATFIGDILRAAVDPASYIDPRDLPIAASVSPTRNPTFRKIGTGEAFLWPRPSEVALASQYLVHNGVFFGAESDDYIADRRKHSGSSGTGPDVWLFPAFDFLAQARDRNGQFQFASLKPRLNLVVQRPFDGVYLKDLFLFAYRQGRMGKEWRTSLPTGSQ